MPALTFGDFTDASATVGGSSAQIIAADTGRQALLVHNPDASAVTAIAIGPAIVSGLGSITLGPHGSILLDYAVAQNAFNAISDTPGAPLTIWVFG